LRQVESYAINEGVEWVILTSGVVWQVYHITGGLPIIVDLALEVDLLGEDTLAQKGESTLLPFQGIAQTSADGCALASKKGNITEVTRQGTLF
jgi:hypothetical protein